MSGGVISLCLLLRNRKKSMKTIAALIVCSLFFVPTLPASSLQEQNKAIAKRAFWEIFSKGNFALAKQLYAKDFLSHGIQFDATLAEDQAALKGWREVFSDVVIEPQKLVAEGDLVTIYWIGRGAYNGISNSLPSTGKEVVLGGITIWRIVDGKIKEEWAVFDQFSMMQQLGLLPSAK
jgi:steroid delta-isomerase-like uncharacterized protein